MHDPKKLGIALVVACAIAAFASAGSASATELTCGSFMCPTETVIEASGQISRDGAIRLSCGEATLKARITTTGGATSTVSAELEAFTIGKCGTVKKLGTLEFHTQGGSSNNNATITSQGLTVELTGNIVEPACSYVLAEEFDLGVLRGSSTTGGTAVIDLVEFWLEPEPAPLCGPGKQLTGELFVTNLETLNAD